MFCSTNGDKKSVGSFSHKQAQKIHIYYDMDYLKSGIGSSSSVVLERLLT
jgi:acyl-CoA hydrolase